MTIANTTGERGDATAVVAPADGRAAAKRAMDLLLGIPLCVLALPLLALLAGVLVLEHRAFPFFVHDRIGTGGRRMAMPKLRTLSPRHDPFADKAIEGVTASSRFTDLLRRTHLDELPQLYLVPFGQMSLVGPRPRMAAEASRFGPSPYDLERVSIRQGCTGMWQISEANARRVSDSPEYDRFYLERQSVRLDLWILWRTGVQLVGAPPVRTDDVPRWAQRRA